MNQRSAESRRRRRTIKNRLFVALCIFATSVSVIALIVLLGAIAVRGAEHLGVTGDLKISERWNAFTSFLSDPTSRRPTKAGIGSALWGTVWTCGVCALFALPIGVATATFLEEFKPGKKWQRKIHGFIQLNITNLAGVPSIVYGILGLTVFVHMFGFLGSATEPAFQIGASRFDQFVDQANQIVLVEVKGRNTPPTVPATGMAGIGPDDNSITLTVVGADDQSTTANAIKADAQPQRILRKHWYYFQAPFGRGVLAGGLTLMLVVLPIIIISTQEALRAVPDSLREGALATGATRWQMVRRMTLPAAVPGIMTGSILAMSRAIGEAAPILIIAGIVYITFTPQHLMDDFTVLPLQIYNWAGLPSKDFHRVAASGIIVLLAVLLTFNAAAIFIRQKFSRPLQ